MSIILGCWLFNEITIPLYSLKKMYAAVHSVPHEKFDTKVKDQTGFGHLLTYNTPESLYEDLPVFLEEEQVLFTAQGRIDNKANLFDQLSPKIDHQSTDGSIILQAYLKWGKNCVHYLRGDWSFVVFNYKQQELFCARDPVGYTSFYYYTDKTGFYFSSSIKSLLQIPSYKKEINELHFVRNLTLWDQTKTNQDTYFQNIFTLPISYTLTINRKGITVNKYWQPSQISLRNYKNKQNYADELSEIFTNAVKQRLRSFKPVASMLSGGLDSSTVSYVAADLLKTQNIPLATFSHIPLFVNELRKDKEKEYKILDETPFINEVAKASGNIHTLFLNSSNYSVLNSMVELINLFSAPVHAACNIYWVLDIYRTATQKGFGTLLSGEGGNGSISFAGMDYLLPFNVSYFISNPYLFVRKRIYSKLKAYFYELLKRNIRYNDSMQKYVSEIFLMEPIEVKYHIIKDIEENNKKYVPRVRDIVEIKDIFRDHYIGRSLVGSACGHYFGLELRDPCTDQDVMEYFYSIPNEAFFDEHYNNRMLVKQMMKGRIPDKVLFQKKRGLQSADIAYRVKAQALELTSAFENVKHSPAANHYIDVKKLSETWQQYLVKPYVEPYEVQRLLKALQFALFLQMNFD